MPAPDSVKKLIDTFATHQSHYESNAYNETEVRREFLDPLFKALGWDIDNVNGYADAYKDVIHEDAIKIGGHTKAPDYCFRIGGQRKFFLEAKKPATDIKKDAKPAYQLRRYAWSAKLPLSILSDFAELAVYDCRIQPKATDKASTARTLYFKFNEYEARWDELASIFSRESILKGSFDKYAETTKKKRGTAEVDDAFLEEIERWRNLLARSFALRNPNLSVRDLNYAVQKTIDRIIFLRICEDRGTEDYGRLARLQKEKNTYTALLEEFKRADDRYNSGLFHFNAEKSRPEAPDTLTTGLILEDKVIKDIVKNLYFPDSPYEFSVLPADILGQVYEQFLGKTISLTSAHKAVIEEKPDVRKAGGVYYTPKYIVDYVITNTLGKLLNGNDSNKPKPIPVSQAEKIKVIDPSCGSGSFLIAAYQYLLDWHRDQYSLDLNTREADPGKIKRHAGGNAPKIYQAKGGEWKLTTSERKRILLNNILGVDIDAQAVEVTKLSLLLKVLEGETQQNLQRDFLKEQQRILPDLGQNICCGNSLIETDFYDQLDLPDFDEETRFKINVFDWLNAFPKVFKDGGFHCVIGNPPWGALLAEAERKYLKKKYAEIVMRMIDSFMYFVAASTKLLREGGHCGLIVPDVVLYQQDNAKLRKLLLQDFRWNFALNAGNVFNKVNRPAGILIVERAKPTDSVYVADTTHVKRNDKEFYFENELLHEPLSLEVIQRLPDSRIPTKDIKFYSLVARIFSSGFPNLGDLLDDDGIQRGVSPDYKDAFIVTSETVNKHNIEKSVLKPTVTGGKQIRRYFKTEEELHLIYTSRNTDFTSIPNACQYIESFSDKITCREVEQGKHPLYSLHRPREEKIFMKNEKLIGVITEDEIVLHLDVEKLYPTDGLYLFAPRDSRYLRYLLGILNSRLFIALYRLVAIEGGRLLAQVKPTLLSKLPIRAIDFSVAKDVTAYDKIVNLVDRLILAKKRNEAEKNPDTVKRLETEIITTERQIDQLVYNFYDLSNEEVQMVEQISKGIKDS